MRFANMCSGAALRFPPVVSPLAASTRQHQPIGVLVPMDDSCATGATGKPSRVSGCVACTDYRAMTEGAQRWADWNMGVLAEAMQRACAPPAEGEPSFVWLTDSSGQYWLTGRVGKPTKEKSE
jgi:hypothetical protein